MELIVLIVWVVSFVATIIIATEKGGGGCLWAFLGFLLGPLALIIVAAMPSQQKPRADELRKCPECAEMIRREARKCRFCGSEVTPA
ncbi:MAG: hypothetical protein KJZ75_11155 [Hyphomonadaceae bacterium]|nr:hypothetical protein [Hyphomonadaceae bacterium]